VSASHRPQRAHIQFGLPFRCRDGPSPRLISSEYIPAAAVAIEAAHIAIIIVGAQCQAGKPNCFKALR
jgi:hypothetical protein